MSSLFMKSGLIGLCFTLCSLSAGAAWQPPEADAQAYQEVLSLMEELEPYTGLAAFENKYISVNDDYLAARWGVLRHLYVVARDAGAADGKLIGGFINSCVKEGWLKNPQKKGELKLALTRLNLEIITDKPPFEVSHDKLTVHRGLTFSTVDGLELKLDLFLPKQPASEALPCIIFIHGGGWNSHKRAWMNGHAAVLANHGYASASIDYRMRPTGATPVDCAHDAKAAVRWIRANAAAYGIDPDRIGASGGSAGAQLSTMLATTSGEKDLEGQGGNAGVSSAIQAAVGFATPTLTGTRDTWPVKTITKGEKPDWYDVISPYRHASKGDAPICFIHGENDGLVNIEEARDLFNRYQELGIKTQLIPKSGKGHVFYMNEETAMEAYAFFHEIFGQP